MPPPRGKSDSRLRSRKRYPCPRGGQVRCTRRIIHDRCPLLRADADGWLLDRGQERQDCLTQQYGPGCSILRVAGEVRWFRRKDGERNRVQALGPNVRHRHGIGSLSRRSYIRRALMNRITPPDASTATHAIRPNSKRCGRGIWRIVLSGFLLLIGATALSYQARAEPGSTIYVIRHLNVPLDETDPDLNEEGRQNAQRLVEWFDGKPLSAIFVSTRKRTMQSALPLAADRNITPQVYDESNIEALLARVRNEAGPVLIVGQTTTIPGIIAGLGGTGPSILAKTDFGKIWTIGDGSTVLSLIAPQVEQPALSPTRATPSKKVGRFKARGPARAP